MGLLSSSNYNAATCVYLGYSLRVIVLHQLFVSLLFTEHDEVFLAVYERSRKEPTMTQTLWAFRARISLENFSRAFISMPNAKTLHPLLHTFLHEVNYSCHTEVTYMPNPYRIFAPWINLLHYRNPFSKPCNTCQISLSSREFFQDTSISRLTEMSAKPRSPLEMQ